MKDRSKPTIRDIARMAGVSRSTVSLVINNDRRISRSTQERVMRVIQESGYRPNSMARGLARRRSQTVGVIVPGTASHILSDPYFGEAISGIGEALNLHGYRLLIQIVTDVFADAGGHREFLREGCVDGLLLVGTIAEDDWVADLLAANLPVVMVNTRRENAASVVADNRAGSREMVKHLASLGHRRIGFIGGLENTTVGEDRTRGFLEGLAAEGIPFNEDLRLWGNFSEQSGAEVARRLLALDPRPTALMAANDMMAIGALRVAQDELGLRVPQDLTVVGADDIPLATYIRPELTTVSQPIYEIGSLAATALLAQLGIGSAGTEAQTESRTDSQQVVGTRVLARASSGPAPRVLASPRTAW